MKSVWPYIRRVLVIAPLAWALMLILAPDFTWQLALVSLLTMAVVAVIWVLVEWGFDHLTGGPMLDERKDPAVRQRVYQYLRRTWPFLLGILVDRYLTTYIWK